MHANFRICIISLKFATVQSITTETIPSFPQKDMSNKTTNRRKHHYKCWQSSVYLHSWRSAPPVWRPLPQSCPPPEPPGEASCLSPSLATPPPEPVLSTPLATPPPEPVLSPPLATPPPEPPPVTEPTSVAYSPPSSGQDSSANLNIS